MLADSIESLASTLLGTGRGRVYWLTGLSGAGKSTVGRLLWERLRAAGRPAIFLDGDLIRSAMGEDLGHDRDSRYRSAMRNARLCRMLASQGHDVVCATISLFHDVQRWNRRNIAEYCEILLRVPIDELRRRDRKGIYRQTHEGESACVVGFDVPAELPLSPDLVLDNHGELASGAAAAEIWDRCVAPYGTVQPTCAATAVFGSKAETLERLGPGLRSARVLPQVRFTVARWQRDSAAVLTSIAEHAWTSQSVIVRSSSRREDAADGSQAGRYDSVLDVRGQTAIVEAIDRVIASFGEERSDDDQIFLQPMLHVTSIAGVAFTRQAEGGSPYYTINYDLDSGRTDRVTSGRSGPLHTFLCLKSRRETCPPQLGPVFALLAELEIALGHDALDVEFAADQSGQLYLLQVRPLVVKHRSHIPDAQIDECHAHIAHKIGLLSRPHPYLHGSRAIFGVMPDWNPAEIIGIRPSPLSLSLYRELVTDAVWAYQRDNYGYQNLRSFPLLVSFHGLPYIDVRVSFNSFIPRDLASDLAARLVNYYIDRLLAQPHLHDKVEFEIIFSCYTLDFPERLQKLPSHTFSEKDIADLASSLRRLTNRIIHGEEALWRGDRAKIDILVERLPRIHDARIDKVSKIYWLLEDCKRYGTLPFAGLARAGFIAVQLLHSFVSVGVLDEEEHARFLSSVDTVGARIGQDFARLSRDEFLARYGHLRPGTYDLLSPRYDEAPDLYFDWSAERPQTAERPRFALSIEQLRKIEALLKEHQLEIDVLSLLEFIKAGIEGREYAKFVFTRSLSDALLLIRQLGEEHGLSAEDCTYLDYNVIRSLYSTGCAVQEVLRASSAEGRRNHALTRQLSLPPLIAHPTEAFAFHLPPSHPNFVTGNTVTAPVRSITDAPESFAGGILFVPSADPGFDWIFTRGIVGFVTQFGGANSHMAIRANELGIPAVIGAGEVLYERWSGARALCLDCSNQKVTIVS